jgi:hypothetical protein
VQQHECNKQLFTYINNFLEFYFLMKIRTLQYGGGDGGALDKGGWGVGPVMGQKAW